MLTPATIESGAAAGSVNAVLGAGGEKRKAGGAYPDAQCATEIVTDDQNHGLWAGLQEPERCSPVFASRVPPLSAVLHWHTYCCPTWHTTLSVGCRNSSCPLPPRATASRRVRCLLCSMAPSSQLASTQHLRLREGFSHNSVARNTTIGPCRLSRAPSWQNFGWSCARPSERPPTRWARSKTLSYWPCVGRAPSARRRSSLPSGR